MGAVKHTDCKLLNKVGETVTLHVEIKNWNGSATPPPLIADQGTGSFQHKADGTGSVGAVEYRFGPANQQTKWIVAWSNLDNSKKVYTAFIDDGSEPNWSSIKSSLDRSTLSYTAQSGNYTSSVVITTDNATPTMTATLSQV